MNRDVRIEVESALLERLIEQALSQGAAFSRIQRVENRKMIFDADVKSADILLSLCKRYRLNARVLRHVGLSAFAARVKARWTLLPGLILCGAICAFLLSRIWFVEISFTGECAYLGKASEIEACLEASGIQTGIPVYKIDADQLQNALMAKAKDYSFIGVRLQGVRLLIEASPEVPAPEIYEISHARDLVAARDGVIASITVHSGEACVKAGDTVLRGQLLIRGEEAKTKEETAPVSALGEVIARCWYEGSASAPLNETVYQRTGRMDFSSRLKLMNWSYPITEGADYPSKECETEFLPIGGLFLPLEIERTLRYETQAIVRPIDRTLLHAQLETLARAEALSKLSRESLPDLEIEKSWVDPTEKDGILSVRVVYEIHTNIAASRDEQVEEVY